MGLMALPFMPVIAVVSLLSGDGIELLALGICGFALLGFWVLALAYAWHGLRGLAGKERFWWWSAGAGVGITVLYWTLHFADLGLGQEKAPLVVGYFGTPVLVPMAWLYLCRWRARGVMASVQTNSGSR